MFTISNIKQRIPLQPAHSISKLRILKGATSAHSPSGAWEITLFHATSTSIWHLQNDFFFRLIRIVTLFQQLCIKRYLVIGWPVEWGRKRQLPGGSSIQLQPTISALTMYLYIRKENIWFIYVSWPLIKSNLPDLKINVGFIGQVGHGIKRSSNLSALQ